MSSTFELHAEVREDEGRGASRRLRRAGRVPAIIYGGGKDPVSLSLDHDELFHNLENEAFYAHVLAIHVGKKKEKAILKDLQRHPYKPILMHADLLRVRDDVAIRVSVPLHFIGEDVAPGVKSEGGIMQHQRSELEIDCLPGNLPEYIEVDVSALEIGDSIHLQDLKAPEGVQFAELIADEDANPTIALVVAPAVAEVEETDEAEDADAEGGDTDGGDDGEGGDNE